MELDILPDGRLAAPARERISFQPHPKTLTMAGDYEYFAAQVWGHVCREGRERGLCGSSVRMGRVRSPAVPPPSSPSPHLQGHHPFVYALAEFVDNSLRATKQCVEEPRCITISILQARRGVGGAPHPASSRVSIAISDNGCGMDRRELNEWVSAARTPWGCAMPGA